jgi:hydrogenase nickel incorporation protein HypA/HybF
MHELSIAQSIIDITGEYTINNKTRNVKEINIEIGELSGVVIEALEFALEITTKGTSIEKTKCNFLKIPGIGKCIDCDIKFEMHTLMDSCPQCKGFNRTITDGKQLQIKSIKI